MSTLNKQTLEALPWKIATTSSIYPERVVHNCLLLEERIQEVAIVLFESKASLAYTDKDIPLFLKELSLSYHLHLPLDLPWNQGTEPVLDIVAGLLKKTAHLSPTAYVLHPPENPAQLVDFIKKCPQYNLPQEKLLLENIEHNDFSNIWELILRSECKICLDIGHLLAYRQDNILALPQFWDRLKMLHIYGNKDGRHNHASLDYLSPKGRKLLKQLLKQGSQIETVVLEVFSEADFLNSLDIFLSWTRTWSLYP